MALRNALKAFFIVLKGGERGAAILELLETPKLTAGPRSSQPAAQTKTQVPHSTTGGPSSASVSPRAGIPAVTSSPSRSDGLNLLATLQRESRFIDLVQEPLEQYTDAQVGAAARPCLLQCQQTLARLFSIRPVVAGDEGRPIEVPANASPLQYQWLGTVRAEGGQGTLVHHGWQAERCELPQWSGEPDSRLIIAPAQVQG